MDILFYIGALSFFVYVNQRALRDFRGSSSFAAIWLNLNCMIGGIACLVFWIWSFVIYEWWQPIVAFIISVAASFFEPLFNSNIIGIIIRQVSVPILVALILIGLL